MGIRARITAELKTAMKNKEAEKLSTLRLINAAIKDQDIAKRGEGEEEGVSDQDVLKILARMVKQRNESARAYDEGGRLDLAERERSEILVIQDFLPKQLDEDETRAAVQKAIADTGADSIRDMGKVMGALKGQYAGQMDFGLVGPMVKSLLG